LRDEQEILGRWTVKFRQWTWEYTFADNHTVRWRDIFNNQTGSGRWVKTGNLINTSWLGSTTTESWYCPIKPDNQEGWYHASYGVGKFQAVRFESFEPGVLDFDYKVAGRVPILLQGHAPVCWAAGVSMMIGWRNGNPGITIEQAISTMGQPYVTLFQKKKGLTRRDYQEAFADGDVIDLREHFTTAAGLKYEPMRSYTPKQLYELMARHRSPVMVEAHWNDSWTHMYVLTRISGSGGRSNTLITYNDPNSGEDTTGFDDLMEQIEKAATQTNIQVWHY